MDISIFITILGSVIALFLIVPLILQRLIGRHVPARTEADEAADAAHDLRYAATMERAAAAREEDRRVSLDLVP